MNSEECTRIVNLFYEDIKRVALVACHNIQDAEDVTQTVFMKLLSHKEDFIDDLHIKKWLIKVTINESRSLWRSFWKKDVILIIPEKMVSGNLQRTGGELLKEAFFNLNPRYRKAIHLYYYEGYSVKEIAELLGKTETSVFKLLQRARDNIRDYMNDKREEKND